jgi:hypothetical protein
MTEDLPAWLKDHPEAEDEDSDIDDASRPTSAVTKCRMSPQRSLFIGFVVLSLAVLGSGTAVLAQETPVPETEADLCARILPPDIAPEVIEYCASRVAVVFGTPETATPTSEATTTTVEGKGSRRTKLFTLGAGDYDVRVDGRSTSEYGGNVIVDLVSRDDASFDETLWNEIVDGKGRYAYDTAIYGVDGGEYYLDTTMPGGTWVVTFTPQS